MSEASNLKVYEGDRYDQEAVRETVEGRQALLGLVALVSLAIPALTIRHLLPDLNPLILAGVGMVAYMTYLAMLFIALSRQTEAEQALPVTVLSEVPRE